jgi:hypothetical protein
MTQRTFMKKQFSRMYFLILVLLICSSTFAMDPATRAATEMNTILFGALGTSISAIILGGTFILAKTGKITWDKFLFIGFCTAGFLGAPSIVTMIKGWVG